MMPLRSFLLTSLHLRFIITANHVYADTNAEEARWLTKAVNWGTLSWLERGDVSSMVTSFGEKEGRLFIMIPFGQRFPGSLTISEVQKDPDQFEGAKCGPDGTLDPEDPRCAKLTISGTFKPVDMSDESSKQFAEDALYSDHPQMKDWPADHQFSKFELEIEDLWMIANFGGGADLTKEAYFAADPVHHPVTSFGARYMTSRPLTNHRVLARPEFESSVTHARWIVGQNLWTTISTNASARLGQGKAWGNIRSVTDGECFFASAGRPFFYLPNPDPTALDIKESNVISLSFSEASLPELVGEDGQICGGNDPEDPRCAKISLHGHAVPLEGSDIEYAMKSFGATHPSAGWLSSGGAHTGGAYYTIHIHSIEFFENVGGMTKIDVDEYLDWKAEDTEFPDEPICEARPPWSTTSTGTDYGSSASSNTPTVHHGGLHNGAGGGCGNGDGSGGGVGCAGLNQGTENKNDAKKESDDNSFATGTFVLGMLIGYMIWGPLTVGLVAYRTFVVDAVTKPVRGALQKNFDYDSAPCSLKLEEVEALDNPGVV